MRKKVLLKDIASFSKGEQINGENLIEDGAFPYLNGGIQPSGRWSACNTLGNTITISEGGNSCGYVNLMMESFWCGAHCYYLYNLSVDVQYLYFALKSQQARLMAIRSGACMPNIKKNDLGCFELTIHTEGAEQKHIVEQLLVCQTVIEQRQRQLRALDTLIKARFVEMFGECDYPLTELIKLIVEGAGLSYGIVQPGDDGTGDMGVLRPVDLSDGRITTASIKYIDRSIGDGFKKTELTGEELLITVRGTTGITALTDARFAGMNVTRGIAVIRYDQDKINPVYLNAYLNTEESQRYIQAHTRGATLQQINLSDLRVQQILVPPRALQDEYSSFVQQVDKSKVVVKKALDNAQLLYDSLMQKYFG